MSTSRKEECVARLAPEVKAFLEKAAKVAAPPISEKTYKAMRQFIVAMVRKVERPQFSGRIADRTIPGPAGAIPVRIYTPEGRGPFPLLLFFHGGGWVLGNLDTEEDTCLFLVRHTPCIGVSVEYRLAPEDPYPAALDDAYAALVWIAKEGRALGGDPTRIAVSGESAGASLAAVVSLMSRDRKGPPIAFQALFYPATNLADSSTESHRDFGEGFFIGDTDMQGIRSLYVPDEKDWSHPYVSPLLAPDLSGLPPALIVTAGCDPLRDEGEAYAERLRTAGVRARAIRYDDMIHAFLFLFKSSGSRREALEGAASAMREALG
ncbi:MAG: alpha/beta hydrolase [Syntrophorhabdales bacterium]